MDNQRDSVTPLRKQPFLRQLYDVVRVHEAQSASPAILLGKESVIVFNGHFYRSGLHLTERKGLHLICVKNLTAALWDTIKTKYCVRAFIHDPIEGKVPKCIQSDLAEIRSLVDAERDISLFTSFDDDGTPEPPRPPESDTPYLLDLVSLNKFYCPLKALANLEPLC